jgi:hypothetical protein
MPIGNSRIGTSGLLNQHYTSAGDLDLILLVLAPEIVLPHYLPIPEVGQQLGQKQTKAAKIALNGLTLPWAASHCEALRCGAKRCSALRLPCGARPTFIHIGLYSPHHKLRTKI